MWKLWDVVPAVPAVSKGRSQAVTPCRRSSKLISHICAEPLRGTKGIIGQVRVWEAEAARSSAFLKFLGIYSLDIERDPDWFWIHPRSSVLEQELGLENMNLTLPLETRSLGATNIAVEHPRQYWPEYQAHSSCSITSVIWGYSRAYNTFTFLFPFSF